MNYDGRAITSALASAKATIIALRTIPYQKQWVDRLQEMELKREVAGTSRIEGADFTDRELDEAMQDTPEKLVTRSQRQAYAAKQTYRWIATVSDDRPIDDELICEIHRRIVTGADEDHCPPGVLRARDQNVNFGAPRHRGAEGGEETLRAFRGLVAALNREFPDHDRIIQSMAAHCHFAAIHPFLDGNGRTARALEALLLQRAGLKNTAFIAMSNYYYDEKVAYLNALAETRQRNHDLTPFLLFALKGLEVQGGRLLSEIRREMQKEVFRNLMYDLFGRLKSKRRGVIGKRQIEILKVLLQSSPITWRELLKRILHIYGELKNPVLAAARDVIGLESLGAVSIVVSPSGPQVELQLDWPTKITETEFFDRMKKLPQRKAYSILQ